MMRLAEKVFDVKNDPQQLNVTQEVIEQLIQIHPSTLSEENYGDGPVAWVMVIPTTIPIMRRFLMGDMGERELLDLSAREAAFDALYLCSCQALKEYRRKGIVKRLAITAIEAIRKDHPLKALFLWSFSPEGDAVGEAVADDVGLPLFKRAA